MSEEKLFFATDIVHGKMWQEEEQIKNAVYAVLDDTLKQNADAVLREKEYVQSGAYEDQDAFMAHGALTGAVKNDRKSKQELASLLKKPYFAHVALNCNDASCHQCLLSDSADLDRTISIGSNDCIVPFKKSSEAPIQAALFHQYQVREASPFTVSVPSDRGGTIDTEYTCQLIRDVEVNNRKIDNVVQLLPKLDDELSDIPADELLALRLDENRGNATLRNIISTLQRQQFEVIQADEKESFVVQGCAGSGKTQCLIHRLFFLRDQLGELGWEKVLLITPTQLFRNYSAELMRRYHLSAVKNYSLSELYRSLLETYDQRFKARQYKFEVSEEYLPDEYLSKVYSDAHIRTIEQEIRRSLRSHIEEGCRLVGRDCSENWCTADFISNLVEQIDAAIGEFDSRAQALSKNAAYAEHLNALEKEEKRLAALMNRQQALSAAKDELELQKKHFDSLVSEIEYAEEELRAYRQQRIKAQNKCKEEYTKSVRELDKETVPTQGAIIRYARCLYKLHGITSPRGTMYLHDEKEQRFLNEMVDLAQQDLADYTKNQTRKSWLSGLNEKRKTNETGTNAVQGEISSATEAINTHKKWLQDYLDQSDSIENQKKTFRSALERSRYYLSRIESSVFEQEVWNALAPLKDKYSIQTVEIEQLDDKRQKQTRIWLRKHAPISVST